MPEISPERLRELAAEIVLDHARDIEYLSVGEMLKDHLDIEEIGEAEYDRIVRDLHDFATTATLTVEWPADGEPTEVERLRAYIDQQDDTIGSLRQDVELQTKAAFDNQAEAERMRIALAGVGEWVAEEYRRCIASARATTDGSHYEKCNGRAEAYRQLADRVAAAIGVAPPNWNAIKEAVPADGVYRAVASS